jgi:hypothetical protein
MGGDNTISAFLLYFAMLCWNRLVQPAQIVRGNPFMISKLRSYIRSFSFPIWSIPIALFIVTLLSYGIRAFDLGFFWDDWPYLWFFHRLGTTGILQAFEGDRPFLSFTYTLCLSILGSSSEAWQFFAIFTHWLYALGFWWVLALTWPNQKHKAAWAAFLFTVYPGFTQQWIAVIYGQAFLFFAAQFFSIGIMLWIARRRRTLGRFWIVAGLALSVVLSAFNMYSTEYFFGLELLRPVLLWLVFSEPADNATPRLGFWAAVRAHFWTAFLWWLPFLALMLSFIGWRTFIHPFYGHGLTTLQSVESSPLAGVWNLFLTLIQDTLVSSLAAWGQPLENLAGFIDRDQGNGIRLLAVMLGTGVLSAVYLIRLFPRSHAAAETTEPASSKPETWSWASQAILVGIFAILISGWPFWISGLKMQMGFPLDRYALPLSVGVSILLAGLIDAAIRRIGDSRELLYKGILLGAMIGLAAGFHFDVAQKYHEDWNTVRDFFWQLTWRAPSVKPDTLFASDHMPFQYFEDDSLTAPLNWTYDPNGNSQQMSYILYDLLVRRLTLPKYEPNLPVEKDFRSTFFSGTTSQTLIFSYEPPGCVRVLDPVYDQDLYNLTSRLKQALPLSNPTALVQAGDPAAQPPAEIFGSEPKHRWCYYFEKADLARQQGNWTEVRELSKQSIRVGYRPEDPSEYLPFIEAYARLGYWDDARQLTLETYQQEPNLRPALCSVWKRSQEATQTALNPAIQTVNETLACSNP